MAKGPLYKDVKHLTKDFRKAEFTNKHGEQFNLIRVGPTVFFTGDELEWQVHNLFNDTLNVYSDQELVMLGEALIELGTE